jgi:carbon monoxide dehydrogenase subunit G
MAEFARVADVIAAPVEAIWRIVTDFAHPQRLAKSIESCQATGERVGDTRTVRARGLVIHERIEDIDDTAFRFRYRVLETGDMPMRGMRSYAATVTLRPRSDVVTEIEWRSEGDFEGDLAEISAHLVTLYSAAIANLRQETEPPAP